MNSRFDHSATANYSNDLDLEQSLRELVGLGYAWARYGLEVGSRALHTSSKSLAVTGTLLQRLSDELAHTVAPAEADDVDVVHAEASTPNERRQESAESSEPSGTPAHPVNASC